MSSLTMRFDDIYQEYLSEEDYDRTMDLYTEATRLHAQIVAASSVGTEGFKQLVLKLVNSLVGLFGKLYVKLKAISRTFSSLKITEWDEYKAKNIVLVNNNNTRNYSKLVNLSMPYPRGMKTTYFNALSKIVVCLDVFDMRNRSQSFLDICTDIQKNATKGVITTDTPILQSQLTEVNSIVDLFNAYDKLFDPKMRTGEKRFGDLFTNQNEFKQVGALLSQNSKHLYQVQTVFKNVEAANKQLKGTLDAIGKMPDGALTKEQLMSLSNACMFFAKTTDMYGITIQDYHRVEHNYVEVHKSMVKQKVSEL